MRRGWAVVLAALLGPAVAAQTEGGGLRTVCRLPVGAVEAIGPGEGARAVRAAPCPAAERTARFEVTYEDFPAEARRAFGDAVDAWACRVRADRPIRIHASWASLDRGTLGTAGPYLFRNFEGAPARDVWYPAALADQLAGRSLDPDRPHIEATFNRDFEGWHFDPSAPPAGSYDLFTVVLHELGHGLGLIGAMTVEDGRGRVGVDPGGPYVYDLATADGRGRPLLDRSAYPDGSTALGHALRDAVTLFGPAVEAVARRPVPLYAPPQWQPGGSYSHLNEDTFAPGTPDGLMTPFIGRSEAIGAPGAVVCAALADLGWTLAGECAALVGPRPLPDGDRLVVERRGPNPVRAGTTVVLSSETLRPVVVSLYDMTGRRVAVVATTVLVPGRPHEVTVDAAGLAVGSYVLVATGGPAPQTMMLTVVR